MSRCLFSDICPSLGGMERQTSEKNQFFDQKSDFFFALFYKFWCRNYVVVARWSLFAPNKKIKHDLDVLLREKRSERPPSHVYENLLGWIKGLKMVVEKFLRDNFCLFFNLKLLNNYQFFTPNPIPGPKNYNF